MVGRQQFGHHPGLGDLFDGDQPWLKCFRSARCWRTGLLIIMIDQQNGAQPSLWEGIMENTPDITWKQASRVAVPWLLRAIALPAAIALIIAFAVGVASFMLYQQPISMAELAAIILIGCALSVFPSFILIGYFSGRKHRSWKLPAIILGVYFAVGFAGGIVLMVWLVFFAKLPGP